MRWDIAFRFKDEERLTAITNLHGKVNFFIVDVEFDLKAYIVREGSLKLLSNLLSSEMVSKVGIFQSECEMESTPNFLKKG